MPERNITFEIKEHLGTIAKYGTGWNKELNIISWNGGTPKFDIRDWDEHHEKMSRGVTLSQWEMRKMADLYIARNNAKAVERGKAIEAQRNARKEAAYQRREDALPVEDESVQAVVNVETGEIVKTNPQPELEPVPESEPELVTEPLAELTVESTEAAIEATAKVDELCPADTGQQNEVIVQEREDDF